MAETNFTPAQVQELLNKQAEMFERIAERMNRMNPIEQRKYDEEILQEKRRTAMIKQLGKIEEESARRKRDGCSHMRFPATMGKASGHSAPRGALGAEWCTGGQAYQDGTAMVICMRCSSTWLFRPSADHYSAILQNGLLSEAPPPEELTLCPGCFELKPKCRCKELYLITKQAETVAA